MPIHKRFQKLTVADAQALPDELGVYEVADMTGRVCFVGAGELRSSLATLATHHPHAAGYRYVKTRTRAKTVERLEELRHEHDQKWIQQGVVSQLDDPTEVDVAPWWPGPRRKIRSWPRDLAIRWNGGWIPLEVTEEKAGEIVLGAKMPGGGGLSLHLQRDVTSNEKGRRPSDLIDP